jgi:hypothetical protein
MRGSAVRSTLRASVFYVGSAVFMATGAVTIADQPYGPQVRLLCGGKCSANRNNCAGGNNTCFPLNSTLCRKLPCTISGGGATSCVC